MRSLTFLPFGLLLLELAPSSFALEQSHSFNSHHNQLARALAATSPGSFFAAGYGNLQLVEFALPASTSPSSTPLAVKSTFNLPSGNFSWLAYGPAPRAGGRPLLVGMDALASTVSTFRVSTSSSNPVSGPLSSAGVSSFRPAHVMVTRSNTRCLARSAASAERSIVFAANYPSSNTTALSFSPSTGIFNPTPLFTDVLPRTFTLPNGPGSRSEQQISHPHQTVQHPTLDVIYIPDLGADVVRQYRLDNASSTSAGGGTGCKLVDLGMVSLPAGSGPRHLVFHPSDARIVYVLGELSSQVFVLSVHATTGKLSYSSANYPPLNTLPPSVDLSDPSQRTPFHAAEIDVSPDGKFLYASNRNTTSTAPADFLAGRYAGDTVAVFSVGTGSNAARKTLSLVGHINSGGVIPRAFALGGTKGEWLVVGNQATENVVVFTRDAKTGLAKKVQDSGETLKRGAKKGTGPAAVLFRL